MRKGSTVIVALVAATFAATPVVIGATRALATSDRAEPIAQAAAVAPAEVAPVRIAAPTACKKVRVVYGGYADAPAACGTAAR